MDEDGNGKIDFSEFKQGLRALGKVKQQSSHSPGDKGGAYDETAAPQGEAARYGPLESFPYRYLMATLRALQMRVSCRSPGDQTPRSLVK